MSQKDPLEEKAQEYSPVRIPEWMSCEEQSLYRNLRKFLHLGIVAYDSKRVSKGPDRKYYFLTDIGQKLFQHFVERNILIFSKESIINLLTK
jgi:DNA-binding PadR family transcriptional regulator